MVILMLRAFQIAFLTNLDALPDDMRRVLRAARNKRCREPAEICTVAGVGNAADHHLHVFFAQAARNTVFAGSDAPIQRF